MSGTLIVSLDFELFWGMQDVSTLEQYRENIVGGKKAIPKLLNIFRKYDIHATWATVGFMFAKDYDEVKSFFPEKEEYPTYENKECSTYRCFNDLEQIDNEAGCFYAQSVIKKIAEIPGMEIGSHTFSHYYCREAGQTVEQFEADMKAAKSIAKAQGIDLTSVVLPRNQCEPEYVKVLKKLGFQSYRDEENDWIHEKIRIRPLMRLLRLADVYVPFTGQGGYRPGIEDGIVNLVGSRMYKPYFKPLWFLEGLKIRRIKKQMLHAAKHGLTFHLWWHPHNIGVYTNYHLKQLETIFSYYDKLKQQYGMRSLNMNEISQEILKG